MYSIEDNLILEITEELFGYDWSEDSPTVCDHYKDSSTFMVSTRLLREMKANDSSTYRYISRIIEASLMQKPHDASIKYSFGDTPDWWACLIPPPDCTDPVVKYAYTARG